MKRLICMLWIFGLLLSVIGCAQKDTPKVPATFYYSRIDSINAGENSLIAGEIREAAGYEGDLTSLLTLYMKGPVSNHLAQTFPKGLLITSLSINEGTIKINLNDTFSQMTNLDAGIACAAILRTVAGLTGSEDITVCIYGHFPYDNNSITLTFADILLTDGEPTTP